jgi:STIP1 family protein 1
MGLWDSAISDCNDCLALSPDNMKAHYYLSQAHLALNNYAEALDHAKVAHKLCITTLDKSLSAITAQVLKCKKECWEDKERHRRREGAELEVEILGTMERERDGALGEATNEEDKTEIVQEWEQKMSRMRRIFEMARAAEEKRRPVPDWAIDDISFAVMIDPVMVSLLRASRHPREIDC